MNSLMIAYVMQGDVDPKYSANYMGNEFIPIHLPIVGDSVYIKDRYYTITHRQWVLQSDSTKQLLRLIINER